MMTLLSDYNIYSMPIRIAINGFGRIGRSVLRSIYASSHAEDFEIVAINELAPTDQICYLLQYDSVHGRFSEKVQLKQTLKHNHLMIAEHAIRLLHEKDPQNLPWHDLNVDIVFESTGQFNDHKTLTKHITAGAKKVLLSQPGDHDVDATIVYGFNHRQLSSEKRIVSNASCTSNCLVPILQILQNEYGIQSGTSTTIHSAMSDQPVNDSYAAKLRLTRSAIPSIVPITTQLSLGIAKLLPSLKGKFATSAIRVPTLNVSMMDVNIVLQKATTIELVHNILTQAAKNLYPGIIDVCNLPLVSMDYNRNPFSATVDLTQTRMAGEKHLKLMLWFDNEWGFANRMLDTAKYWHSIE